MKVEEIGPAAKRELAIVENERTIAECKKETDLLVDKAVYWAQKLVDLVDKCGMSKEISGKKYLKVEAWQLIGEFAHTTSKVEWCNPWLDADNKPIGYKARVVLVNGNGEEVGAGESSCGFDAFPCRGKQGSDRERAAASSAQTWATSKAFRNKFSFVAVLGGYQPTPAEEMNDDRPRPKQKPIEKDTRHISGAYLGGAIMRYTNDDGNEAKRILKDLCGLETCKGMTNEKAAEVYKLFEEKYLSQAPAVDEWEPGVDG